MTNQNRCCNTSNSARYRCDSVYDRLNCCIVNISAELAFCIYIDSYIDDRLTRSHIRSIYTPGAAFLNVMAPCPRGWRYPSEKLMEVTKMAVETCVWPLYEVVEGKYILSYKPKNKLPVEEYLKMQGRFAHMFKPGNEWMIEEVQKEVDKNWEELLKLCEL